MILSTQGRHKLKTQHLWEYIILLIEEMISAEQELENMQEIGHAQLIQDCLKALRVAFVD